MILLLFPSPPVLLSVLTKCHAAAAQRPPPPRPSYPRYPPDWVTPQLSARGVVLHDYRIAALNNDRYIAVSYPSNLDPSASLLSQNIEMLDFPIHGQWNLHTTRFGLLSISDSV
ncbi:hypothetical protein JCM8097_005281 [Rhodosporidiobolus ruineniae]